MTTATARCEDGKGTTTMNGERYLNVGDVAALLGVSPKTVCGRVYAKTIPHVKFSRSVLRFRLTDIEAWAESRIVPVGSHRGHGAQGNTTGQ